MDIAAEKKKLEEKWGAGGHNIRDVDVMSHAMYPAVFDEYMEHLSEFGPLNYVDTRTFLTGKSLSCAAL